MGGTVGEGYEEQGKEYGAEVVYFVAHNLGNKLISL